MAKAVGEKECSAKTDVSLHNVRPTDTNTMCHSVGVAFCTPSILKGKNVNISIECSFANHAISLIKTKHQNNMRVVFKSISKLYHYTKFDTAIKILRSRSLRFGKLHDMNDIHENDKISYVNLSGTPINSFPSIVLDSINDEMTKYRQISFTTDVVEHNKLGFDLHQMWGLYANKGQGVCLVFDKEILCNNLLGSVWHRIVSYDKTVDSFCVANSNDSQGIRRDIQGQVEKLFFHKREEWEHEQEYRLIKRCSNLYREEYLDYGDALKFIILNSVIENVDVVKFNRMTEELNNNAPKIPILVYGNGLLDYSLCNLSHTETIWTSSYGYNTPIPGENCKIDA